MTEPFRTIIADPPWLFKDRLPGKGRGASKKYPCMKTEDICRFDLPPLSDDSVLFMWRVAAMQDDALQVMKSWGFTLKSEIVWEKRRRCSRCRGMGAYTQPLFGTNMPLHCGKCNGTGTQPAFGMGHYVMAAHETCLIGVRGRPQRIDSKRARSVSSVFQALVPTDGRGKLIHSAKPDEINRIAERLYHGPFCEFFAGRQYPGWTCLGNESGADGLVSRRGEI